MHASDLVLVTGAAGFVGRGLVAELVRRGRPIRAAVRLLPQERVAGAAYVEVGDLSVASTPGGALERVRCVIHAAARAHVLKDNAADPLPLFRAVNRDATLRLARQAAAVGARRFVFLSSIGVNGATTSGRPLQAGDSPAPHSPYAVAKLEAEQGLLEVGEETGLEIVIVRPPLVVGPGAPGNIGALVNAIAKGMPLPFGSVTANRRDLVSLSNLVDLVATCIDHPAAAGGRFLVSDGAPLSTRALIERLGSLAGRRPRLLPVPPLLVDLALRAAGKRQMAEQLLGNLEVDIGHTKHVLGWSPHVSS
jgi:nucleoside-diphosphate-sugar epimerase